MPSLENSPFPLVFRVANAGDLGWHLPPSDDVHIRVLSRSLEGMQKEAVVLYGPTGAVWRMVSDEGPYLNGTDLAPFPLAFFTTGLAAGFLAQLLALASERSIDLGDPEVILDSRYAMSGSALKGTMKGEALPLELKVSTGLTRPGAEIHDLIRDALESCPGFRLLAATVSSEFGLRVNGEPVTTGRVHPRAGAMDPPPDGFEHAVSDTDPTIPDDIIVKLGTSPETDGEGGAGSSLAGDQKRTLHVRGIASLRPDGIKQIRIDLFRPVGSSFRFLSDDSRRFGGAERAPSGLAYLSAALAFCYMTQLGRYAQILRKPIKNYRLIQDLSFLPAQIGPVSTQVDLDTPEGAVYGREVIDMGQQTCFLHAACRASILVKISNMKI